MVNSRTKGQVGERELFAKLSDDLGFVVRRNVDQFGPRRGDGYDIPGCLIEVKRCQQLRRPSWMNQARAAAAPENREAFVFYRQNRKQWRALVEAEGGFKDVTYEEGLDRIRRVLLTLGGQVPPSF